MIPIVLIALLAAIALTLVVKVLYDAKKYIDHLKEAAIREAQLDPNERIMIERLTMKEINDLHNDGFTVVEKNGKMYTIRNANWNSSTKNSQPSLILK
jgi:hypothetical protein